MVPNQSPYIPEIRFADIDAMGHVNNAVYLSYLEQARIQFFREMLGTSWKWNEFGILVASNHIDYLLPVYLHDKLNILIGCDRIGTKSFTLSYQVMRMTDTGSELCSKAYSVLVCYNHAARQSTNVPQPWRNSLQKLIDPS